MARGSVQQHPGLQGNDLVVDTVSKTAWAWGKSKGNGQKSRADGCGGGNSLGKVEISWKKRKSHNDFLCLSKANRRWNDQAN